MQTECNGCPVLSNPVFRALPPTVHARAACIFAPADLKAGTPLLLEGFPTHSLFAIRSGVFKTIGLGRAGRERVLRAHGPGEFIGLESMTLPSYPHTVVAATDARVCHAPMRTFVQLVTESPEFSNAIIGHLCDEVRQAREDAVDQSRDAASRVARLLFGRMTAGRADEPPSISLLLSHRDTAAMLGLAQESFSRLLTLLEERGVIRRKGRRLLVEDRHRLSEIARG